MRSRERVQKSSIPERPRPVCRILDKYAVRAGGGYNHRFALYDGVLIKDNHITAAGGIGEAVRRVRGRVPHTLKIEVEVKNPAELEEALAAGADAVLLDNMGLPEMAAAVKRVAGKIPLEASGNMTLERVREVAATGVDLISVGALTHSATAADISLNVVVERAFRKWRRRHRRHILRTGIMQCEVLIAKRPLRSMDWSEFDAEALQTRWPGGKNRRLHYLRDGRFDQPRSPWGLRGRERPKERWSSPTVRPPEGAVCKGFGSRRPGAISTCPSFFAGGRMPHGCRPRSPFWRGWRSRRRCSDFLSRGSGDQMAE